MDKDTKYTRRLNKAVKAFDRLNGVDAKGRYRCMGIFCIVEDDVYEFDEFRLGMDSGDYTDRTICAQDMLSSLNELSEKEEKRAVFGFAPVAKAS